MFTDPSSKTKTDVAETATVRKFMFDRSFDNALVVHRAAEPKPVVLSQEQVDALKKEAFDSGFAEGKIAGHDAQTAQLELVLIKIGDVIDTLSRDMNDLIHQQQAQTRLLVLAIAKKILPDFTGRNGVGEIESLLTDTIREMSREPRLVVRITPDQFDAVDERIQSITTRVAYAGKVIVLTDETIAPGDCRIEWADGGIERDTQATWQAIEQTLQPSS